LKQKRDHYALPERIDLPDPKDHANYTKYGQPKFKNEYKDLASTFLADAPTFKRKKTE